MSPRAVRGLLRSFYVRPTLTVAQDLVGKVLVHETREGTTSGTIVEVEAYIGEDDPACHAAPGPTVRNQPLYGPPGYAYVYLNYGIHCLVNVVTEAEGTPAAVLIRALEPVEGIDLMRRRRGERTASVPEHELCRGPGNLTKAMGITLDHNRLDVCAPPLRIVEGGASAPDVAWSSRIGISVGTDRPWRCFAVGCRSVSGRANPA